MIEIAHAWYPVPDVDDAFGRITFSSNERRSNKSNSRSVTVLLHGERTLSLEFNAVVAFHFEDDCPGTVPLPKERPRLNHNFMFPLLRIENSKWRDQWFMWPNVTHHALLSLDDLVHIVAAPDVIARWIPDAA